MKKVLAAAVFSAAVFAFGETESSQGSLTTVFETKNSQTQTRISGQEKEVELEKLGQMDFEKISENAPTTNQAKDKPEERTILEELEKIESKVITIDSTETPQKPAQEKSPVQTERPQAAQKPATPEPAKEEPKPAEIEETPKAAEIVSEPQPEIQEVADAEAAPEAETNEESEVLEVVQIVPSRTVEMKNNQYLDVVYPGNGWAYLGETEDNNRITFFGRKLGNGDTSFTLRSRKPGESILHFYKNDNLTGEYIDDYLLVKVSEDAAKNGERAIAPKYENFVPKKPERRQEDGATAQDDKKSEASAKLEAANSKIVPAAQSQKEPEKTVAESASETPSPIKNESVKTVIQTTTTSTVNSNNSKRPEQSSRLENIALSEKNETPQAAVTSEELLVSAKASYDSGKFESALEQAQGCLDLGSTKEDEVLYLLGQIYESESSVKNIRSSIDSYDTLVRNFPASPLWQKANQRSIYLKRFYIDIR